MGKGCESSWQRCPKRGEERKKGRERERLAILERSTYALKKQREKSIALDCNVAT